MYVHSQQNLLKDPTEVWKFTVNTEATAAGEKTTAIPLNLYSQNNVVVEVDWGDGTTSTLTSANYTNGNSRASVHEYETAGVYQVTMKSSMWNAVYLQSMNGLLIIKSTDNTLINLYWFKRTVVAIDSIFPKLKGIYLGTITSATYISGIYFSYFFYDCKNLTSIPAGLFDNNTAATDFTHCFSECSSLQSIPYGLFDSNTAVTSFYRCFHGCSSLQSIPSGLFDSNTAVTNFQSCFRGCSSLQSIPAGLFDKNTAVTDFSYCFYSCSSLQSIPSGLFNYNTATTSFQYCFQNCTSLTSIPAGLFDNCTAATSFYSCFQNCPSFQSIPAGLFDSCTAATSFQYCFASCSSLQSIPSGLFDNNVAVTSFNRCFSSCPSIQSIPSGLFDNNTAVTDFSYCFYQCSSIQSIPAGLFHKNTAVTNFSFCFYQCSLLKNFKLIIGSPLVTTFSSFVSTESDVIRIVCVPDSSTTYTKLSSYANTSNNITVSTYNLDCFQTLEYTVDTDATTANAKIAAIPLAAVQNASSKLLIDWGDGNGVELTPEQATAANLTHTYSNTGNYQITVGALNWLDYQFLADSAATSSNTLVQTFKNTVVSIDGAMPPVANNTNLDYWFYNCTHLTSYSSHIFDNLPNATSATAAFKNCTSLAAISAGTLRKQEALVNASKMFAGCILPTYVPSGLLSQCKLLTNISSIFNGCTNLATIPNTLLLNNTAITNQTNAFAGCSNSSPTFLTKAQFEANGYFIELHDTEASEENGSVASIPFTLYEQSGSLTIDWGDGNTTSLTASNYTNSDATASSHQYSNIGLYFIAVQSSNWNNACPCGNTTYNFDSYLLKNYSNGNAHIFYRSKTLVEVPIKLPTFNSINAVRTYDTSTGIVSYNKTSNSLCSFYECCKKLKLICNNLFENHSNVTNFASCFSFCHSLQLVPTGLFNNCTAVTDFSCCFYRCYSMQSIPAGLFDSCTAVTNFASCFYNCSSMQSIPAGLFDSCTAVIYFGSCFNGCSSIASIPAGLFDSCTAVTSFYSCFAYNSITSIPAGLFDNNTAVTDFKGCFAQCKKLSTIPNDLFKYNINVTQISTTSSNNDMHLFEECISLKSIPEHLFDSFTNVTIFNKCFYNCTSLQSIPSGLFDKCTAATNFSYCFQNCTSLQSIPSGLFDNCTEVTTFYYCFSNCTSLQSIPSGLFDKNTAVTNFQYCFYYCSSLQSIPAGLFDKNTAATSFNSCFYYCTSLQSIPAGLFDKNTAVSSFQYCFSNCTSLPGFTLYIGSSLVSNCSSFVTKKAGTTRIVYVPANSTTYTTFSNQATTLGLTVNPIEYVNITLESSSDEKTYDNTALTGGTVTLSSGSLAEGDSFTYQMTGRQELIGSSDNTFTYSLTNNSETNYRVTCEYGTLTVTDGIDGEEPIDDALICRMTAEGQEGSENEMQYKLEDTVTFEISVKNPYYGSRTITLTEIEDVTLAQSTFESVAGGDTVSTTATYTVTEDAISNGSFTNTVTASIGNLTKTAECTILTEEPNPHISIDVEIDEPQNGSEYVLNEEINYSITVTNDGNVSFADTITVATNIAGDEFYIDPASFHPADSVTFSDRNFSITSADVEEGYVIETITVSSTNFDGNPYEDTIEVEIAPIG